MQVERNNSTYSFADVTLNSQADFRLWVALTRARDLVIRARGVELASHGISAVETQVLLLVHDAPEEPTPADLCRWVLRKHNTVSALLRRMEKKGLLVRSRDADKQNQWRISLTEQGEREWQWATQINAIRFVMSEFSQAKKDALESLLTKIGDKALTMLAYNRVPADGEDRSD